MQFDLLKTEDIDKNGLYLDFFQVYNWGVFDSKVYTMRCGKKATLLTGLNGSGKTTLVDAFLSLIVPPRQRFYNQSAGAESKRERDEISYVLGTYGNKREEEFTSGTAKNLRTKENCISILLGCFVLGDDQRPITLMQVRFFSGGGALQKIYSITHTRLSIEEIQKAGIDFTPQSNWKKRMTEVFGTKFYADNFAPYAEAFSQLAGLRSDRALYLFSQTVGLKGVGNLNDFIRTYMFEGRDTERDFDDLVKHYEELSQIYNEIEKAQEQIRLLQEILDAGKIFGDCEQKNRTLKQFKTILQLWYIQTVLNTITKRIVVLQQEKLLADNKRNMLEAEIKQLEADMDSLKAVIQKNSTAILIKEIEHKIQFNELRLQTCRNNVRDYEQCARVLSLEIPQTEKKFNENIKLLPELKKQLSAERGLLYKSSLERNAQNQVNKKEEQAIIEELESLSKRTTNIPAHNIGIRDQICAHIGCSEKELVFAGELLQVAKEESRWEAAIEKLLHNFALCLLVPPHLYTKVNTYAATHNLRGRLVYLKTDTKPQLKKSFPEKNSLIAKLEIQKKHELSDWLEAYLYDTFDYICTDDTEAFSRAAKALTSTGLIKSKIRHEKDDRPQQPGRQAFVLGWDNIQKRQELSFSLKKLQNEIAKDDTALEDSQKKQDDITDQLTILAGLEKVQFWDDLDVQKYSAVLNASLEEKEAILRGDKELRQLENKLQGLQIEKQTKEEARTGYIETSSKAEQQLTDIRIKQERFTAQLHQYADRESEETQRALAVFAEHFSVQKTFEQPEVVDAERDRIESALNKESEQAETAVRNAERKVREKMSAVKNPKPDIKRKFPSWEADVRDFQAEVSGLADFQAFYDRVNRDDLPSCRKKFKLIFNEHVKNDITNFKTILDTGRQQIIVGIEELNKSLKTIPYSKNPPTYIKLENRKTTDQSIKDFQALLLAALPDSASIFNRTSGSEFEEYKKIETLIAYLKENDPRRKKVLDVRQWFNFAAIEYYLNDNTQKQYYEDSASLSGGEKSKLTYTILASAIAFQFGITGGEGCSLRLVIIDEVFSKIDMDNSCYAMELFKEIGLQMILVTPMDKINIVEDYIASVHITEKHNDNTSRLLDITIDRYQKEKERVTTSGIL